MERRRDASILLFMIFLPERRIHIKSKAVQENDTCTSRGKRRRHMATAQFDDRPRKYPHPVFAGRLHRSSGQGRRGKPMVNQRQLFLQTGEMPTMYVLRRPVRGPGTAAIRCLVIFPASFVRFQNLVFSPAGRAPPGKPGWGSAYRALSKLSRIWNIRSRGR